MSYFAFLSFKLGSFSESWRAGMDSSGTYHLYVGALFCFSCYIRKIFICHQHRSKAFCLFLFSLNYVFSSGEM